MDKWEPAAGLETAYKAFVRKFETGEAAVVCVIATCAFTTGGYQVRLTQTDLDTFAFEMLAPGGAVPDILTYEIAGIVTGPLDEVPNSIVVADAAAETKVPVLSWDG